MDTGDAGCCSHVNDDMEPDIEKMTGYLRSHVYRSRPQPQLPPRDPAARRLARGRESAQEDLGQPHRLARGEGRFPAPSAQGPAPGLPRSGLHHRTLGAPRPRRAAPGDGPALGARPAHRPEALPRARPGRGDGRGTSAPSGLEARHHPAVAYHDVGRRARPGRCRRGRAVRGDGLAARASGAHQAPARPAPSARRRAGVRRRERELLRGAHLPADALWLQPRRQARSAPGGVCRPDRSGGMPGGGPGLSGPHRRPEHRGRPSAQAARALRARTGGAGRGSGPAHAGAHRTPQAPSRIGLGERVARAAGALAGRERGIAAIAVR